MKRKLRTVTVCMHLNMHFRHLCCSCSLQFLTCPQCVPRVRRVQRLGPEGAAAGRLCGAAQHGPEEGETQTPRLRGHTRRYGESQARGQRSGGSEVTCGGIARDLLELLVRD